MELLKYKLNNWAIVTAGDPYKPPELMSQHLVGDTEGHPKWPDGHRIVTSRIIGYREDRIITTGGSAIALGDALPDYETKFPNAKERLFDAAPAIKV